MYGCQIRENFRTSSRGRSDRQVLDILKRLNNVLGRLGDEAIVYSILPVQKEHRVGLKAAAQRIKHAGSNITWCEAALGCFGAINSYVKLRIIEFLLNPKVGYARDLAELGDQLIRE